MCRKQPSFHFPCIVISLPFISFHVHLISFRNLPYSSHFLSFSSGCLVANLLHSKLHSSCFNEDFEWEFCKGIAVRIYILCVENSSPFMFIWLSFMSLHVHLISFHVHFISFHVHLLSFHFRLISFHFHLVSFQVSVAFIFISFPSIFISLICCKFVVYTANCTVFVSMKAFNGNFAGVLQLESTFYVSKTAVLSCSSDCLSCPFMFISCPFMFISFPFIVISFPFIFVSFPFIFLSFPFMSFHFHIISFQV